MDNSEIRSIPPARWGSIRPGELVRLGPGDECQTKLVFVHGNFTKPSTYRGLLELLQEEPDKRTVYAYHYSSLWGSAESVARNLTDWLRRLLALSNEARLILVGHSLGGLLVRRATLMLHDARAGTVLSRIDRLLLLSSTNRGFEPIKLWHGLAAKFLTGVGWPMPILDALRGAPWVTRLRIEWIETFGGVRISRELSHSAEGNLVTGVPEDVAVPTHPWTIEIDGDRDRIVRPGDILDLELFKASVRHKIAQGIGHADFTLRDLKRHPPFGRQGDEALQAQEDDQGRKLQSMKELADQIRTALEHFALLCSCLRIHYSSESRESASSTKTEQVVRLCWHTRRISGNASSRPWTPMKGHRSRSPGGSV